jgi:hypothetical protein
MKIGKPPWCCPRQAEFWRLCCTSWCAAYWNSGCAKAEKRMCIREKVVRLPGVAPGHSPWRGDILLLNHSRMEIKGPGLVSVPTHAISTKNKHLLLSCDTNPRFHGGSFGVWGTPPAQPLNCKSVSNRLGARIRSVWAHHAGGTPRRSCDRFRLALSDIIKTSFAFHSQFRLPFVLIVYRYIPTTKSPAHSSVSRVIEILCSIRYLLTFPLSKIDSGVLPPYGLDSLRLNTQP